MKLFLLFLVALYVSKSICIDVEKLSMTEKIDKLKARKLPPNALDIDERIKIGIGKSFNIYNDVKGNTFYTLRYETKDPIITKQLNFHLKLIKTLQSYGLFLYETVLFCDDKSNYLVFSPQDASNPYFNDYIGSLTLQQTQNAYREILKLFQIFENHKAAFIKSHDMMLLLSSRKKINFTPVDLAFIYHDKQPCYIYVYFPQKNKNFCSQQQTLVEGDKSIQGGVIEAQKEWNIHNFAYMIESYSSKHSMSKFEDQEKKNFISFKNRLKLLTDKALIGTPINYTWKEMVEFIKNWGESTVLAQKIDNENSILMTIYNFYSSWFITEDFYAKILALPPRFREGKIITKPSIVDLRPEKQRNSLKVKEKVSTRSRSIRKVSNSSLKKSNSSSSGSTKLLKSESHKSRKNSVPKTESVMNQIVASK